MPLDEPKVFTYPAILTVEQAAELIGVGIDWLYLARQRGTGPRFIQLNKRFVRYEFADVMAFLRQFKCSKTQS
jgi:predicted DNA-binding transcriptional regulator AlpA